MTISPKIIHALLSKNRKNLIIAVSINKTTQAMKLWTGKLTSFTIPFDAFEATKTGILPDFDNISIIDHGQTLKLGNYEVATDAITK